MINRKIAFRCNWCYTIEKGDAIDYSYDAHNVIGVCEDVRYEDVNSFDSDILVKIKGDDKWHTLYTYDSKYKKHKKIRVRIYNYTEGPKAQRLELNKVKDQYNI